MNTTIDKTPYDTWVKRKILAFAKREKEFGIDIFAALPPRAWIDASDRLLSTKRLEGVIYNDIKSLTNRSVPRWREKTSYFQAAVIGSEDGRTNDFEPHNPNEKGMELEEVETNFHVIKHTISMGYSQFHSQMERFGNQMLIDGSSQMMDLWMRDADKTILDGYAGQDIKGFRNATGVVAKSHGKTLKGGSAADWSSVFKTAREELVKLNFITGNAMGSRVTMYVNNEDWVTAQADQNSSYFIATIEEMLGRVGQFRVIPSNRINTNEVIAVMVDERYVEVVTAMEPTLIPLPRLDEVDPYFWQLRGKFTFQVKRDAANVTPIIRMTR